MFMYKPAIILIAILYPLKVPITFHIFHSSRTLHVQHVAAAINRMMTPQSFFFHQESPKMCTGLILRTN